MHPEKQNYSKSTVINNGTQEAMEHHVQSTGEKNQFDTDFLRKRQEPRVPITVFCAPQ